jgi:hypothetical protein
MGTELSELLLAQSCWHHCNNGLLSPIATSDVAERQPGPAVIWFPVIDML